MRAWWHWLRALQNHGADRVPFDQRRAGSTLGPPDRSGFSVEQRWAVVQSRSYDDAAGGVTVAHNDVAQYRNENEAQAAAEAAATAYAAAHPSTKVFSSGGHYLEKQGDAWVSKTGYVEMQSRMWELESVLRRTVDHVESLASTETPAWIVTSAREALQKSTPVI